MKRILFTLLLVLGASTVTQAAYFPETQHNLTGRMESFWLQHGGLPVFGYPISEAFHEPNRDTGQVYLTQYVERNRFEAHPENAAPYDVLLGLLGKEALVAQGRDWQAFPKADPSAANYVAATGHAIAHPPFWAYYRSHGLEFDGQPGYGYAESVALFGLPLSEPTMETNSSGDTVLTQWFERARFEDHGPNGVLLGLLGTEVTRQRRGEVAFAPALAQDEIHLAARHMVAVMNQRRADLGLPAVRYRDDVQAIGDQVARDWTETKNTGGDTQSVIDPANTLLAAFAGFPQIIYLARNVPMTAQCKGVDPTDPIGSRVDPIVTEMRDITTVTIGVYGPYDGTCGTSLTTVYIVGN